MIDEEDLFGLALDEAGNALPVCGPKRQRLEYQKVECSLQEGETVIRILLGRHPT